ncbi:restriction endonuclease subunit S [Planococcus rifietoensis]|uniref:restriction endonuclease subunit S n=1 Tax=Planococcus rifietoensis TaxID=200991 RepID=UPI00384B9ECB
MKNNKQPAIRLAGHAGKWKWKKLNEISTKVTEKNKDNLYSETLTNSAEFGIVSQRDFFEKDISNVKNLNGYYVVRPDDFVYNPRISNFAPVGPIKRNKLNRTGVMSPLYYVFRTKEIDNSFLERYFSSKSWHLFMKLNGDSGARSDRFAIKDVIFGEMPIPFPSIEEQKEIGDFFHKLEETIILHQQELEMLKQTKQGLLKKMIPKDGESVPEFRLPDFVSEWKKSQIGEIATIVRGASPRPIQDSKWFDKESKVGWLRISDVTKQDGRIHYLEQRISMAGQEKTRVLKEPHLLLSIAATVGKPVINYVETGVHDGFLIFLNPKFDIEFMFQWLEMFRPRWNKYGQPGSQVNLNSELVKNQEIYLPDIEEQIQIGNFFKKLDELIALQQQELDALKQTKQAFLQKIFV